MLHRKVWLSNCDRLSQDWIKHTSDQEVNHSKGLQSREEAGFGQETLSYFKMGENKFFFLWAFMFCVSPLRCKKISILCVPNEGNQDGIHQHRKPEAERARADCVLGMRLSARPSQCLLSFGYHLPSSASRWSVLSLLCYLGYCIHRTLNLGNMFSGQ